MKTYNDGYVIRMAPINSEWVPAEVAHKLYEALVQARKELEDIALEGGGEAYNSLQINDALAAADGVEVET